MSSLSAAWPTFGAIPWSTPTTAARRLPRPPSPAFWGVSCPFAPVGYNAMLTDYIKPDERFIVCPNQDVAYGAGFTALDKEPTVVQVPFFFPNPLNHFSLGTKNKS